jgi:citrate lyase gamma subunit
MNTDKISNSLNSSRFFLVRSSTINAMKLCWTGLLLSCLTPWQALAIPPKSMPNGTAFAQLSSRLDQQAGDVVRMELKDSLQRMSSTGDSVTVNQGGSYIIIASPQVTATKDGGCLDAWLVLNGKDVKNSGVRLCQAKSGNTNVLVCQAIMHLNKGDKIQVKTSGKDAMLDAISPKQGPLIPSIIFSVMGLN